ncbi:MAG TPA: NAD(+) diphosphatase [Thermoanaerobaculia bacterium]|jgi:NAD+ diphosphatase|nr:NAD(+) diphosphatase [Thermoanaerobaculia bacterium]
MFDRCAQERVSPPREGAITLVGIDGESFVAEDRAGEIFLGRRDGTPLYVDAGTTFDFRAAATVMSADDVALLSYAQGMLNWTARTNFCSVCASALEVRQAGHVRVCTNCNAEFYPRTDPAVMMLVTHRGRLLLAQHKGRPHGMWSTLAGFVEPGESLEDAAKRELMEETGLTAVSATYFGSQSWPLPASLMIGFVMEVASDAITIDESELSAARFYEPRELDAVLLSSPISLSRWMIDWWRRSSPSLPDSG